MTLSNFIPVVGLFILIIGAGCNINKNTVVYEQHFDSKTTSSEFFWKKLNNPGRYWGMEVKEANRVSFINDEFKDKVVRITVRDQYDNPAGAKAPRSRAEIKFKTKDHETLGEYYYSWRFLIPDNEEFTDVIPESSRGKKPYHFLAQWHDPIPKSSIDTSTFNTEVPIFLEYMHDTSAMDNMRKIRIKYRPTTDSYGYKILYADIEKGKWINITMHINWALDDSGYVEVWVNRKHLLDSTTMQHKLYGPNLKRLRDGSVGSNYFKVGHYRRFHNTSHTIYFDDFRIEKAKRNSKRSRVE